MQRANEATSPDHIERVIAEEKLRVFCERLPRSIAGGLLLALVLAASMQHVLPDGTAALWLSVLVTVHIGRLVHKGRFDMKPRTEAQDLHQFRIGVLVSGVAWGLAGFLLYPTDNLQYQTYLALALAGLTTAGIVNYAIDIRSALLQVIPSLLPFVIRLCIEGGSVHLSMAMTMVLCTGFIILSIRHIEHDYRVNIVLQLQAKEREAENQEIAKELQESAERFRSLTELSSDWYWEQDSNYRFRSFEGATAIESGIVGDQQVGKTRWEIGASNMTEADWHAHRAVLQARLTFHDLELCKTDAQGEEYWASLSGRPIFDTQGNFQGYRGIGRIITEQKRAQDETQRMAFYDTLTGLPNRRALLARLPQAIASSKRSAQQGALLFVDLDNFKMINDTYGHHAGDQLLQHVARRLTENLRESDTVARFGGDEFVVILENLSGDIIDAARQAESLATKLLNSLNLPYTLGTTQHVNTPSIGIAMFGGSGDSSTDDLLKRADSALYQAKDAGRNTLCFFDPEMQAEVSARAELEVDLRQALHDNHFLLHYQPQVDREGRVTGVEALLRWPHPTRGMIPPCEFIPVAEESHLILPLGRWVLETACDQLATWALSAKTTHLTLSVNVSPRQMRDDNFVDQVLSIIATSGANPKRLKLEITESQLLHDVEKTIRKMEELKAHGVGFSLDDFGTGYSSLTYLKRLPLDQLKIDQSFIRDVMSDQSDATIARSIISLGQNLGLTVIAEGVETNDQLEFLAVNGCTAYQGYLFSRPVPIAELSLWSAASASK